MIQNSGQSIRPQFHFSYKSEAIILDSQYNYEGNILAVSNSQGSIYLYSSDGQESSREPFFIYNFEDKKQLKNNAIIKIAWSLPLIGLFASCSIYQTVSLFKVSNKSLLFFRQITTECIPVVLSFCPNQVQCILSVGLSNGLIKLYNNDLQQISKDVQAHLEVINCLCWYQNIYNLEKNKWVLNNLANFYKNPIKSHLLLSCSSDYSIKIWKFSNRTLQLIASADRAHEKHVRMVDWKTNYFCEEELTFASCSEDCAVKIWSAKILEDKNIATLVMKGSTMMKGPVYKIKYNEIGNLLAVSYCNEQEQKVETKIFKQLNGTLCQQLKIQN